MGIISNETVVFVRDLDEAIRFYTHQLGLRLMAEAGWGYARLSLGESLHLGLITESAWAREYPDDENLPKPRVAFACDDVHGEIDRMKAAGVQFGPVHDMGKGRYATVFSDTDGNPFLLWNPPV